MHSFECHECGLLVGGGGGGVDGASDVVTATLKCTSEWFQLVCRPDIFTARVSPRYFQLSQFSMRKLHPSQVVKPMQHFKHCWCVCVCS